MKPILYFILIFVLSSCFYNKKEEESQFACGNSTKDNLVLHGDEKEGQLLYKQKCATCHYLQNDGTGPSLGNILQKIPDTAWFKTYVSSEISLIDSGDEYYDSISQYSPVEYRHNFQFDSLDFQNLMEYFD